jgi:general secretion pathway protein D
LLGTLLLLMGGRLHAEAMTLNLKEADINAVISTVSEMTGKNFIVDPRVKGRVTVISSRPMEAEELYQVFLSVLDVHGFAAVPGKDMIKIVPGVNAKQDAVPTVGRVGEQAGGQTVTRVIQVNNVAAAQLVPILRPLMPQEAHLAAYAPTNVLIASGTAANIDRMVDLVRRIDLSSETENELIPLKHASAGEVERILNALQQNAAKAGAAPGEEVKIIADIRTNSVLLSGDKSSRMHLRRILEQLDTPLESSGNTRVIYLHYAKAVELAEILNGIGQTIVEEKTGGAAAKGAAMPGVTFKIQPDESTNALVINAPLDVMRDLEGVIRQLDVRRAQVMVKAVVAEVSTDSAAELGIQWAYDNSDNNGPVGLIDFNNTIGSIAKASQGSSELPQLDGLSLVAGDFSKGAFKFGALIRVLSGDTDSNILSTPTLVTLDNEEAEIVVGQNVPFITGSFTSTGTGTGSTNPFQTIQREDIGLKLTIKPQINEGDAIRMEISHELSSISNSAVRASDLITNKRSVKTTVMVDDGKVLVLGGLIDDKLNEVTQKVPLLGDIPVLGWLFRYQSTQKVKQDLMVFLHPRILREDSQSMSLSSEKYNYMRARQLDVRARGVKMMRDEVAPLLPEMSEFLELPPPYEQGAELASPPQTLSMEPERDGAY